MTDVGKYNVLEDIFSRIDNEVSLMSDKTDAIGTLEYLLEDGGGIEVIGDTFEPQFDNPRDVIDRSPNFETIYGLDGSTTGSITFNNGLMLNASIAQLGSSGKVNRKLNDRETINFHSYYGNQELDVEMPMYDNRQVFYDQLDYSEITYNNITKWLTEISRTKAEGEHLRWNSIEIDKPLFVDGPLYPTVLFTWFIQYYEGSNHKNPMNYYQETIENILSAYIESVERFIRDDIPIFGLQKTTSASRVIDSLKLKKPEKFDTGSMPWKSDSQLFNKALEQNTNKTTISYTPWYTENKLLLNDNLIEPFYNNEEYEYIKLKRSDHKYYRRSFFYVKPPTNNTVFRIGVPTELLDSKYSKEELRDIALSEISQQYKEPRAITDADDKVRIIREARQRFKNIINEEVHTDYNEQRNYNNFQKGDD